jgi:NAD(P)-dependent dehydrogenase (short-subunit alcohol dehydrogenase family)
MMASGRLEGKVALVTGAASNPGLGRATALRLAEEGASLMVTDVDVVGVKNCAQAIEAAGGKAQSMRQDVVNNAGIAILKPIMELTLEEWNRQIEVNLSSVFLGCQAAIGAMQKRGGGSIINLSSVAGIVGLPRCSAYGAAKGGVRTMSKAVAVEAAEFKIRCNSVHPGVIWTNMQAQATGLNDPAGLQISPSRIPLGRHGEPLDIANCILYLASDESNYVTGAEFVIDAGMTAQ